MKKKYYLISYAHTSHKGSGHGNAGYEAGETHPLNNKNFIATLKQKSVLPEDASVVILQIFQFKNLQEYTDFFK